MQLEDHGDICLELDICGSQLTARAHKLNLGDGIKEMKHLSIRNSEKVKLFLSII